MSVDKLTSSFSRVLFVVAVGLFFLAIAEKIANMNRQTLSFMDYDPGRLLEMAGILLLFVIAVTLRRIRRERAAR